MPQIKPFNGIIYNLKKIKDIASVIAPPYDVIPPDLQERFYRKSPYNVIRLTLGKINESDSVDDNRYTRAKRFFESWLKDHSLVRDKGEAIYIYSQKYKDDNKFITRIGFLGLMKLMAGKKRNVLPHENTLLAPKLDRLNLIRATKANFEPIFVLYEDRSHKVLNILKKRCFENKPFIDIQVNGVRHTVWKNAYRRDIRKIKKAILPKTIFIADGHHRYEMALTYSIETQNRDLPERIKRNSGYMMAYFVEMDDDMLTILPTHRLVKDIGILKKEDMNGRLVKFFDIEKAAGIDLVLSKLKSLKNRHVFGMYLGRGSFYILKLKDPKVLYRLVKNNSKDWKRLDVTILHLFILEYVLGIRDEEDNVAFLKDPKEAIKLTDKGKNSIAFFLNPTKVSEVRVIAKLGERMPRKATYFHPKPLSGLVMNKLY